MSIGGVKRENVNFESEELEVGLGEYKVILINPSIEEYKEVLGREGMKEDSKVFEYLGETKEGDTQLRIDVWGEHVKTKKKKKVVFFLVNKQRENTIKEGEESTKVKKYQFINVQGTTSWATSHEALPAWFKKHEFRKAFVGEGEFYDFVKTWLGNLDFRNPESTILVEWKQLMKGNVKAFREQINGEWAVPFVWLNIVRAVDKDGEIKHYPGVYSRDFLPAYTLKQFRLVNFADPAILAQLQAKADSEDPEVRKQLKNYQKFVLNVTNSEYGCKDFYILGDVKEYDPSKNPMSTGAPIIKDDNEESGSNDLPF